MNIPIDTLDPEAAENTMLCAYVAYGVWRFTRTFQQGRDRLLELEQRPLADPGQYQLALEERRLGGPSVA